MGVLLSLGLTIWGLAIYWSEPQKPHRDPPVVAANDLPPAIAEALAQFRESVLKHPQSSITWGRYGMCLYAHEYTAEALECFVEAEHLNREDHRWPYLQGLCTTFSDPKRGLACFERSAALKPDLDFIRLRAAELAVHLNREEQANAHLQAVLNRNPSDPRANLAAARLAFLREDWKSAREKAELSLQFAPDNRATNELLAKISFQQRDQTAAEKYLQAMQQATHSDDWPDPILSEVMQMRRDSNWEFLQAQLQMDQGNTESAIGTLTRLVAEHPDSVEYRLELVQGLLSLQRVPEAIQVLEEGLTITSDSARLHRLRGELYALSNEHKLAAREFRRAIELKPNYALAHYNLGKSLENLGDTKSGSRELAEAYRLQPSLKTVEK